MLALLEGFPKLGLPFWGSHNKDYSIFGCILGSSYSGKIPLPAKTITLVVQSVTMTISTLSHLEARFSSS